MQRATIDGFELALSLEARDPPARIRWSTHLKGNVGTHLCMHADVGFRARGQVYINTRTSIICRGRVRFNGFGWDFKDGNPCVVTRWGFLAERRPGFSDHSTPDGFDDALDGWNQRLLAGPRRADGTELNSRGVADRGAPATVF